jgi:hypothetical protein
MELGDLSTSEPPGVSVFSKTWYRDFTLRELNSSSPKSGLSDAEGKEKINAVKPRIYVPRMCVFL